MLRRARLVGAFALGVLACGAVACGAETNDVERAEQPLSSVPQTEVERLSIGSVWLFAHIRWVEALHAAAAPQEPPLALSPTYLAYWSAFDQILSGAGTRIATGGNWKVASSIVARYGLCPEAAFAASNGADATTRLDEALALLDASLARGALHDPQGRRDPRVVRAELDRAFRVGPDAKAMLDRVFGEDVSRTFAGASPRADATGTPLLRNDDVRVAYPRLSGTAPARLTLASASTEWRTAYVSASDTRTYVRRIERAIDDGAPVLLTWFVDFGALEGRDVPLRGTFNLATLREQGPGQQAGHTALVRSYELDPVAEVRSVRVPGEWGAARPEIVGAKAPYHDVLFDYLLAPIKRCVTRDGVTDTSNCPYTQVPLESVVLPPGY